MKDMILKAITNGELSLDDMMDIQNELLLCFGPYSLEKVISKANELKGEFERDKAEEWF